MAKSLQILTTPVFGLVLTPQTNQEIDIGRVKFISAKKIPRVRKRLALKHTISEYKGMLGATKLGLFSNADTYAVLKTNRDPSDQDLSSEFKEIQNAFWIMASSFACFNWRQQAAMSLRSPTNSKTVKDVCVFDGKTGGYRVNVRLNAAHQPNICEGFWVESAKRAHFFSLLKMIDGKSKAKPRWRASIKRAAILFGQSYLANHRAEAFTYTMIAIETLLSERGDKFPDTLVRRIVAILGWMTKEDPEPWKETISRLYNLRCGYVHDGKSGDITGMDLFEADTLLKNLLTNLCKNTKHISSKSHVISLAEELAAYQTLGMPPKRKPKFTHQQTVLSQHARDKINNTHEWEW